jgi:hypothetical protein
MLTLKNVLGKRLLKRELNLLSTSWGLLKGPFPSDYRLLHDKFRMVPCSCILKQPVNPFFPKKSPTSSEQGAGLCYFCPFWDSFDNRFLFSV